MSFHVSARVFVWALSRTFAYAKNKKQIKGLAGYNKLGSLRVIRWHGHKHNVSVAIAFLFLMFMHDP